VIATEGDETAAGATEDNSLGRLLALSDGVFAIAMTLLALDLRLPAIPDDAGADEVAAAVGAVLPHALTFLLSFYVVAAYWRAHHRIMRGVTRVHWRVTRETLGLLCLVAALPFPTSLLAEHAGAPVSLAVYGAVNVVASALLLLLRHDVRALGLATERVDPVAQQLSTIEMWGNLVVFALCIPAGFLLGAWGAFTLALLAVSGRLGVVASWLRKAPAS
jgi:uncharacterized membrane protein